MKLNSLSGGVANFSNEKNSLSKNQSERSKKIESKFSKNKAEVLQMLKKMKT